MTRYRIVTAYDWMALEERVNEALKDRWACAGGIMFADLGEPRGLIYMQAVTIEIPDNPDAK